jgi:hypothetical protein
VTDLETIRDLMAQARRTLALRDAGAVGPEQCLAAAEEMRGFLIETTVGLLDLADRAAAIGGRAEELFDLAMEIEEYLSRSALPVEV